MNNHTHNSFGGMIDCEGCINERTKKKYPKWYKIVVYSLYAIIIASLIAIWFTKIEQGYYETQSEILNSEKTIRNDGLLKRMRASWYDYKLDDSGKGRVCFMKEDDCYTETHRVAASRNYPRGTMVVVCLADKSKCVEVKITDYIEHPERDIDLSSYAFSQLTDLKHGLIDVTISVK